VHAHLGLCKYQNGVQMEVVEIQIVGRRYTLRSERPAGHLQAVAHFVDEKLHEVTGGDPSSIQRDHVILAALNIASELFLLRERRDDLAESVEETIDLLLERINLVLGDDDVSGEAKPD